VRRKKRWVWGLILAVALATAGYQVGLKNFAEREKALRSRLRHELVARFHEEAAEAAAHFGLHPYRPAQLPGPTGTRQDRAVVLIHGLDDPGKVWMNLAPALATEGHQVYQLLYPNDQPIHDSALYFANVLKGLRSRGIRRIAIVAHSMGGLVSREMLTHPGINYQGQATDDQAPEVYGLIMVGTPNQGVEIARFRILSEFREQISRTLLGQGHWLGWLVDGAGEAKLDLLPESSFLKTLNGRPHPPDVALLTIAGIAAGLGQTATAPSGEWISGQDSPRTRSQWAQALKRITRGVGDGLVPVDAVRIEGVDFLTVPGNHLTMIRNFSVEDERIPPAIPIILDHISRWEGKQS